MASIQTQFVSGAHAHDMAAVRISQTEYDGLVKAAHQYACLRQNLLKGGVDDTTIDILSRSESTLPKDQKSPDAISHNTGNSQNQPLAPQDHKSDLATSKHTGHFYHSRLGASLHQQHENRQSDLSPPSEDMSVSVDLSNGGAPIAGSSSTITVPSGFQLDRWATRTIQLLNLADNVTHADITTAVRGGQLLDVFIRERDRTANVSFVCGEDAKAFFARARRNDLYIKNKRVELKWSDRQYTLPSHVAHRLKAGASRNLVIRDCDPNHTEQEIRDDLEHIHNLIVINVNFLMGDCHIKTNSVRNAIFARNCMMSRVKYKYSRIEWAVDECAQPPIEALTQRQSSAPAVKNPLDLSVNRFQLLNLGGSSGDFSDDNSDVTVH